MRSTSLQVYDLYHYFVSYCLLCVEVCAENVAAVEAVVVAVVVVVGPVGLMWNVYEASLHSGGGDPRPLHLDGLRRDPHPHLQFQLQHRSHHMPHCYYSYRQIQLNLALICARTYLQSSHYPLDPPPTRVRRLGGDA